MVTYPRMLMYYLRYLLKFNIGKGAIYMIFRLRILIVGLTTALALFPPSLMADDVDCIRASNLSSINLTSNNSFAEISWKVDISNTCSYPISMGYKWEAFDSDDFLLDSDSGFGEIIPPNRTVSIKSIALLSPPAKAQKVYRQYFTPNQITRSEEATYSCISVIENNNLIFDQNDSFTQLGWSAVIRNQCATGVKANITNYALEGNSHALDYDRAYSEYFPPNASKAVFGTHLVDSELNEFITATESTIKSAEIANLPTKVEYGEWIWAAGALLDVELGVLAAVIDIQDGHYYEAGFTLNPDLTFTFLPATLATRDEYLYRHSSFSAATGKLTLPNIDVENYPNINVLEHTELQLIDADSLTFSVASYSDAANPNFTYSTNETLDCLRVEDADIRELSRNTSYAEISYKIEVSNSCSQSFEFSSYLHFLTQYHVEIDYDLIYSNIIEANSTKTFSGTTLLDPIEIDNAAKIYVKISP